MNRSQTYVLTLVTMFTTFFSGIVTAADLVVQESGPTGTYASIGAAVSAAADGDRIIINNTVSGLPWAENILINKSLTFLSAVDNQRFLVQGNYTVQHAPGREVTIIGMDNVSGDITSFANGTTSRAIVNIMWCDLGAGDIQFNHDYFDVNIASSLIDGNVTIRYGKVLGNQFFDDQIGVNSDILTGTDSIHVVGNIGLQRIVCNSSSHYVYVSNNAVMTSASTVGIDIYTLKNGIGMNVIRNNSIRTNYIALMIQNSVTGKISIYNNIMVDYSTADYGIRNLSAALTNLVISYNFLDSSFDNGALTGTAVVNDGTNTISNDVTLNADGSSAWIGTVDGGNPGVADYDLNLTRNDPGAYGGSYSLDNFFPIDGASSKVFYLRMPSQIQVGGSNGVTGYSFDR